MTSSTRDGPGGCPLISRHESLRRRYLRCAFAALFAALLLPPAWAGPAAVDDTGREVRLEFPARRIVSLAPHATELLFSAGAGDRVVGAVRWSDFPEAARDIPRVGDTYALDLERIVALRPDLVVAWQSGNGAARIEPLFNLGLTVFLSEPRTLEQIADSVEALGRLAGTEQAAAGNAGEFRRRLAHLRGLHAHGAPVRVFYQIWHDPIFTVNGDHIISRVIDACGGRNVFAELAALSPGINVEAVLAADPDVIVASGADEGRPQWLDAWSAWPALKAVRDSQVHYIPPALIQRHTLRILEGTERMCAILEGARNLRKDDR